MQNYFTETITQEELLSQKIDYSKPVIGLCPDWRFSISKTSDSLQIETTKTSFYYYSKLYQSFKKIIEELGGQLLVLPFEARAKDFVDKLDGYLIPGGRDIDPSLYGEENKGSQFDPISSKMRYEHVKDFLQHSSKSMPVLGICCGY